MHLTFWVECLWVLRLAALSQIVNSKLFSPCVPPDAVQGVPLHSSAGIGCSFKEVENDTVGLTWLNYRRTLVSTLPLCNHLKKSYVWLFVICRFLSLHCAVKSICWTLEMEMLPSFYLSNWRPTKNKEKFWVYFFICSSKLYHEETDRNILASWSFS